MTETIPVWATILIAVIGSGASGTLIAWMLARIDRKDRLLTRDDLDQALAESTILKDVQSKLDRDYQRLEESERDRHSIKLAILRLELFAHTRSRTQHERQLEAGKEYIDKGGNGLGHARYEWLAHDYEQRLADCDWDYTTTHHTND